MSCTWIFSAVSSRIRWFDLPAALLPPPSVNSRLLNPLNALWPGSCHGGRFTWLCTLPMQMGRSASPAMKPTMTSCPMRGIWMPPSWLPAQGELTRTQQLLCWFFCPCRSQGNCTLMRPSSSVHRFWPSGPTTSATCGPTMAGLGWVGSGRNGSVTGWTVKSTCTRHCCLRS
ncbi:hypothetical protein D9M68_768990 [compost metagenome]